MALAFLPPLLIEGASLSEWFGRALVFLVVSCPCALVVSIPLSFFGGIGGASRNGILVKGAAYAEHYSNHPIAAGVKKAYKEAIAEKLGIDRVYAGLLPHQKVEKLESIMRKAKGKTVFVGDGINDAPSLARADIGVAMGGVGSDAAIEAADVVIMTDEISKVATAVKIARKTNAIVWQNIFFALGVKALIMAMGAYGTATLKLRNSHLLFQLIRRRTSHTGNGT